MAGNSDRGIILSPVNRAARRAMAAPIGARSQEVVRVLEEPSSETLPRTSNFASVVLQNYPRTPQTF